MFHINEKDVIRIEVELYDLKNGHQIKKFAIDPRLTNYSILLGLLIKAFNIKREFLIHYLVSEDFGVQFHLPLLSDWDLDTAILTASDPILHLRLSEKKIDQDLKEHQILNSNENPRQVTKRNLSLHDTSVVKANGSIKTIMHSNFGEKLNISNSSSILNQVYQHVEKTVNSVQRVFSNSKLTDSTQNKVSKQPMSDVEFKNYIDESGRIINYDKFRQSVYLGGLEPSLRKVGWRLLLNIYPRGLTRHERLGFIENKIKQYESLKHGWKQKFKLGKLSESEVAQISLVSVDVIRTDKSLNFYSGENGQKHVCQLFDILATYSICHPSIGYHQGMSDLASPLLYVQSDEAVAYLCFCSLMSRLRCNFQSELKSNSINLIFIDNNNENNDHSNDKPNIVSTMEHFYLLLLYIDRDLVQLLRNRRIDNLFFAHRWILLEMKREFSFPDCLRLFEVQWASLPQCQLDSKSLFDGVPLCENGVNDYLGTGSLFLQFCSSYLGQRSSRNESYAIHDMTLICSLVGSQYTPSHSLISSLWLRPLNGQYTHNDMHKDENAITDFHLLDFIEFPDCDYLGTDLSTDKASTSKNGLEPPKPNSSFSGSDQNIFNKPSLIGDVIKLPAVDSLGLGNPFLLFLGVSLLLEYRDCIVKTVHDVSDIIQLYQNLNKRHNTAQVLSRARALFDQYLRDQDIS